MNRRWGNHSPQLLIILGLTLAGLVRLILPVLAGGTPAGTQINNSASGSYEDAAGTVINATSNQVTVTIAEVAGITVTASGVAISNDADANGIISIGDLLAYTYTVTNVGNDPTKFFIPGTVTITGPATQTGTLPGGTAGGLQYSIDGGTTWINVPAIGLQTTSIAAGGSILVRAPLTVAANAQPTDVISATLGNTPGNAQNQSRSPDANDVYTVDNADGSPGEIAGVPVNGTREASAIQSATVSSSPKTYALSTLLKTRTAYSDNGTLTNLQDDLVTYGLSLRVENTDPTGNGITPAPLVGTSITVNGAAGTYILVSDAIPNGTQLAVAPSPPPGWQVVYTDQAVTTNANAAPWVTNINALPNGGSGLAAVKRVGFVYTGTIAPGTTVSGFAVQVRTTGAPNTAGTDSFTLDNIAQSFGQSPGSPVLVYDESGDQNPSNYDGSTIPPGSTDTNGDGVPDTSPTVLNGLVSNTTTHDNLGVDTNNNNTGTGPGGEVNTFTITEPLAVNVLNGPLNAPDAFGPTSQNDDFTNKSSSVPANLLADATPRNTFDPAPVAFTNTTQNSGTSTTSISLLPTPPAVATNLPDRTVVTVTYNGVSKVYVWDQGGNRFLADADGDPTTTGDQTPITATNQYITVPGVLPSQRVNYQVEVNLPAGSPLSTDINAGTGLPYGGAPVPITAFIDDGTPGLQGTEPNNITIDRVYTGFLRLLKESRVLVGTGPALSVAADGTFSTTQKTPAQGNIIEYRITYSNISETATGTGNSTLSASNVVIQEDGIAGNNNWAKDNDTNGVIDTSNVVGSAQDTGASTITFYSGNPSSSLSVDQTGSTANTDVTRYVDTITGLVGPGTTRQFSFQRKVN